MQRDRTLRRANLRCILGVGSSEIEILARHSAVERVDVVEGGLEVSGRVERGGNKDVVGRAVRRRLKERIDRYKLLKHWTAERNPKCEFFLSGGFVVAALERSGHHCHPLPSCGNIVVGRGRADVNLFSVAMQRECGFNN